ncbi:MAG: hypothetical protein PUF49_10215 [Firmicutes bacterium]|nr:hypothetical protein [Bacillota bacterium]
MKTKKLAPVISAFALGIVMSACGGRVSGESASAAASAGASAGMTTESEKAASTEPATEISADALSAQVIEKMKGVSSLSQQFSLQMEAESSSQNDGTDISMAMDLATDVCSNPSVTHTKGTVSMSLLGQETSSDLELYSEETDGKYSIYSSSDGKTWTSTQQEMPKNEDLYPRQVYEMIAGGDTNASLRGTTEQINGKEVYVIDVTLKGDLLKSAMQQTDTVMNGMMEDSSDAEDAAVPAQVYIYKDTMYPAGIAMDAEELGNAMIRSLTGDMDAGYTVKTYQVRSTFDNFDKTGKITIPEEIKAAAVSAETGTGAEASAEQTGDAGEDLSGKKWQDMVFSMDGKVYQIPFAYAGIKDRWTFNLSDYGYDKGYVLNPGDKVTGTIQLKNSKYSAVRCTAGFMNTGTEVKDILDTDIWSFTMDISSADQYPEVELPGGITWGSTEDDIIKAYGKPDEDPYVSKELGYSVYNWFDHFTYKMKLTVYKDGGLKGIMLENYEK